MAFEHDRGNGGEVLAEQTLNEAFEAGVRGQLDVIEAALLKAAEADSAMVTEAAQHVIGAGASASDRCWWCWAPMSARTRPPTT